MTSSTTPSSSYINQMRFAHALTIVRAIPQNSTLQPVAADKLQFYGLYKQATEGDVNIPRPSSRQVVDYAKWKVWSRMKGISPMEAQKLYVESLIQLLTELVHRYPRHEQASFLTKALESLEMDIEENEEEKELFLDAYDPTEFELQEHFLNNIEADQLMREDISSPPNSSTNVSSFRSTPPAIARTNSSNHQQHNRASSYYNNRHHSFSDVSHSGYPLTPITSPGQNSVTGQWVLNQLQQQNLNNSKPNYVHPMDFLQPQKDQQPQSSQEHYHHNDILSEADTLDREVAAATSNLVLSSPRQSPYSSTNNTNNNKKKSRNGSHHSPHLSSSSTTTTNTKSDGNNKKSSKRKADNSRALEKLQTEVTALTEQIDRLRRGIKTREERDQQKLQWSSWRLTKTLIKHLMANSAILLIAFYILWRRKSPIAYSIINYIMPIFQDLIRRIIRKVVFWKITV